jgi:hypothetical protein
MTAVSIPDSRLSSPRTAPLASALALALGFTLLYLSTPTRHYTFDAVAYAYQIEQFARDGRPGWLFHAHHLLFNAAGWGVWVLLREVGLRVSSLEALQVMNAVLGGLGVGLFALALSGATGRSLLAVSLAALLGVSHGYWTCATDGRVNIPGLVGVLAAFAASLRWVESGSWRWALASGALTGTAVLFHQSHVLFVPVLALAALLARTGWRPRAVSGLIAAVGVAIVVAGGYLTAAVVVKGIRDLAGLQAWLWQYGADGRWWSLEWRSNLPLSAAALARAVWPVSGPEAGQPLPAAWGSNFTGFGTSMPWGFWLGSGFLLVRLPSLLRRYGAPLLLCGAWFLIYAAFFTIWNPGYFPFWLPSLAAAWMAVGLITAGLLPEGEPWRVVPLGSPGSRGAAGRGSARDRERQRPFRRSSRAVASQPHGHLLRGAARLRRTRLQQIRRVAGPQGHGTSSGLKSLFRQETIRRVGQLMFGGARLVVNVGAGGMAAALALALFFQTYRQAIRPRMEAAANPYLRVAEAVRSATRPGDLVLATGTGWLAQGEVYIPYFSGRPLLAMQAVLKRHDGDKEAAFDQLRHYMQRCWNRGGEVYILDEALKSGEAYQVLLERYGLSREEARQFFEVYAPRPVLQAGTHSVWQLSPPLSTGDTLAAADQPARMRVLGMRERLPGEGATLTTESGEAASRTQKERAQGGGPLSANGSLARRGSDRRTPYGGFAVDRPERNGFVR